MTNEEKFKNRVKDLLDEQYYPYDASNWDVARNALDEEDAGERRGLLYFLFSGVGLGLIIIFFLIISDSDTTSAQAKQEKDPAMSNTVPGAEANTERQGQHATIAAVVKNNSGKTKHAAAKANAAPLKPSALVSSPLLQPMAQQQPVQLEKTSGNTVPTTAPVTTMTHEATNGNAPDAVSRTVEPGTTLPPGASVNTTGKNNEAPATLLIPVDADQPASPSLLPDAITDRKQPQQELEKAAADSLPAINNKAKITESLAVKDTVARPAAPLAQDSLLKPAPQPELPKNAWAYVEAGTFFNPGWKYKNTREGMGFNIYVGLSYLAKLSNKAAFSIGGYYTTLSGLTQSSKEIRSSKVVFGEQTDVISIAPATLNYLVIPAKLHWAITKKQSLTIGYTAGYLLDVQSKVQTYTEVLNAQADKKSYKTGGYVEGFKTFTSQLSLGYRRQLYGNLWLNGEVFYGLTDLRDNTFFGINLRESMTGLKISLTYNLIKK